MSFVEVNSSFVRISELPKEKITELCMIDYSQFSRNDLLSLLGKLDVDTNYKIGYTIASEDEVISSIIEKLRSLSETRARKRESKVSNKTELSYPYQQVCFL